MTYSRFSRTFPAPATWIAWLLVIVLSATLLAACGGGDDGPAKPGSAATPTAIPADAEVEAPAAIPSLMLPIKDVRSAAYSPDGSQIALTNGSTIWIYTADLQQVRALKGHDEAVRAVAWSPDGSQLASASLDGTARVWDVASGSTVTTFKGHRDWVVGVAWSPGGPDGAGAEIVSGGTDDALYVWDAATGDKVTQLGASRVQSIQLQFANDAIFETISEVDYAETLLVALEAEPFTDLVAQLKDQEYTLTITFGDPAQVAQLMALRDHEVRISITTPEETLSEEIDALLQSDLLRLTLALDDPAVLDTIQQLADAEEMVAAINARDDADLIRAVRSLQNEEVVLVITTDDGGTTVASPADDNFISELAAAGDNATITFGIENQDEIAARLQDPEFLAAVQQLDDAQNTISEITSRDDAEFLLLIRRLLAADYTLTLKTGDAALDAELAALDNAERIDLLRLRENADLLDLLTHADRLTYTPKTLRAVSLNEITSTLAPLDFTVSLSIDDAALQAELDPLTQDEVLRLAELLNSPVLAYQIDHAENAQAILDQFAARDDADFILTLRQLEAPRTVETIFSVVQGTGDVRISRKRANDEFVLTVTVNDEAAVLDLSAQSDAEVTAAFKALSGEELNALIADGVYTTTPALDPEDVALIMAQVNTPMFTVTTQREANGHTNSVTAVAWSPAGNGVIASASADKTIRLWDVTSGRLLNTLELDDVIIAVAWSPDGTQLVSGDWEEEAVVWDLSGGAENADDTATLTGHEERVLAVAWSPDGAYVLTGSRDGTVGVWDAASGDQLALLTGHGNEVRTVAWSPDGTTLLSAGLDGTVRLWDAAQVLGTE